MSSSVIMWYLLILSHTLYSVQCVYKCALCNLMCHENEVTVGCYLPYSISECSLGVFEAQVLGESLKFISKLHTIV